MAMPISRDFSAHLRAMNLIAALFVVYIHATTHRLGATPIPRSDIVYQTQAFFGQQVLQSAVPFFFACSALFLQASLTDGSAPIDALRKRVKTVAVPYLLWSALWAAVAVAAIAIGFDIGRGDPSFIGWLLIDPIPGQYWYLRDLVLLVPIGILASRLPLSLHGLFAIAIFALWVVDRGPVVIATRDHWSEIVSREGLAWFLATGAVVRAVGIARLSAIATSTQGWMVGLLVAVWIGVPMFLPVMDPARAAMVTAGVIAMFASVSQIRPLARSGAVQAAAAFSFVIYVAHNPIIRFVQEGLLKIFGESTAGHMISYAVGPLLIAGVIIAAYALFARIAPAPASWLNGGRVVSSKG